MIDAGKKKRKLKKVRGPRTAARRAVFPQRSRLRSSNPPLSEIDFRERG
jgi:hypothetical protein